MWVIFIVLFLFISSVFLFLWFDDSLYVWIAFSSLCVYLLQISGLWFPWRVWVCVCICLKFESILTTLNFPPFPFTVFHIIFCIFSFCASLNYLLWIDMILFLLSFNLPSNFTTGWSMTFTICSPLPMRFFFCNFNIPMSVIFSVYTSPFNIVIKKVLCYWSQLVFACL